MKGKQKIRDTTIDHGADKGIFIYFYKVWFFQRYLKFYYDSIYYITTLLHYYIVHILHLML